jgi:hypothetical protein
MFDPKAEPFADSHARACQQSEQHLVAAFGSRDDLPDLCNRERWFLLLALVHNRQSDEVEVPVPRIELLAFARYG